MFVIYHINNIYCSYQLSPTSRPIVYRYDLTFQYNRYVDKSFLTNTDNIVGVVHVLPILTRSMKPI